MNTTKTIVLMVGLTVLLVFIGGAFGGRQGMIMAFIFAFGDEHVQLLVQRQDCSAHVQRAGSRPKRKRQCCTASRMIWR